VAGSTRDFDALCININIQISSTLICYFTFARKERIFKQSKVSKGKLIK
jgi:hypothetical protein